MTVMTSTSSDVVRSQKIEKEWKTVLRLLDEMRSTFARIISLMDEDGQPPHEAGEVKAVASMVRMASLGHVMRHLNRWSDNTVARRAMAKERTGVR